MNSITIIKPDDFHIHLREGERLPLYTQRSASFFARALVMPNTKEPLTSPERVSDYSQLIKKAAPSFEPLMTFKLTQKMKPETIPHFKKIGVLAGKLYPSGATTNSEDGIEGWRTIEPVLEAMAEYGIVLSIHGEDPSAPSFERERAYLKEFEEIVQRFPKLKVVLEHISTKEGVDLVTAMPSRVGGTVTVHHLLFTIDTIFDLGFNPHYFCRPLLQTKRDRQAIEEAVLSSDRLFFGSDSAPHPVEAKERVGAAAGIYSTPVALPLLITFFEERRVLSLLEPFLSLRGAQFYGLPPNKEKIIFVKERWQVPNTIDGSVPLWYGKTVEWCCLRDGSIRD